MSLRRTGMLVVALALTACQNVTQEPQAADLVFATFNADTGQLPLPNDLVLQAATARMDLPAPSAQFEVLRGYARSGGFPSDVEAAITIPFHGLSWNAAAGTYLPSAPPTLDAASVTAQTVAVLRVDVSPVVAMPYDPVITEGKLTLRPALAADGSRRWPGGRYVVAVRGGQRGVKAGGKAVQPESAIALAIPNKDLSIPDNQPPGGLSPALAARVNGLRTVLWNKLDWQANAAGAWSFVPSAAVTPAFQAVDAAFPHGETAAIATFGIDRSAHVALDSGAGQVPFPSDFMLETQPASATYPQGCLVAQGAPLPCVKYLPTTFGPAADGLRFLDGFSTTALLLAPLTGLVDASTITWNNVHLFELPAGGLPVRLKDLASTLGPANPGAGAAYVTQPPGTSLVVGGKSLTTTLVLAPAVSAPTGALGFGTFYLPPLKEKTRYAVVVTKRVKNADGTDMTRGAVANILLGTSQPLFSVVAGAPVPLISGPDGPTAAGLQQLRDGLAPLLAALPALTGNATTKDDVAMVYTITTQTVTKGATDVQAFAAGARPTAATFLTPAAVGAQYGVDATAAFPGGVVSEFAEVTFTTMNLLLSGRTGGMFDPGQPTPEPVTALVALPNPALVTAPCPAGFAATRCAPLVVFRHGLPRSRGDMLPIATMLASRGFVVAAIDAEKHGDRTYCGAATQAAADLQCFAPGGTSTCVADPKLKTSVDAGVVGRCSNGLLRKRVDCADADLFLPGGAFNPACYAPKGVPLATGNFVISANFFRARDTFRQDVIDQAALVNALAPTAPPAAGADPFFDHLAGLDLAIHPDQVHFASLSFGAANAALSVAVNPRFKKGAFQSGFATITDAFFNPESRYYATATALLATFDPPVLPGTAKFTQFQQVAKWILDPADPANFGAMIRSSAKPVLSQIGLCDSTVPNAQSAYFTAQLGLPVPAAGAAGTGFTQWFSASASSVACPDAKVGHGWLIDPTNGTLMTQAQASFADFLATSAAQPTTVRP